MTSGDLEALRAEFLRLTYRRDTLVLRGPGGPSGSELRQVQAAIANISRQIDVVVGTPRRSVRRPERGRWLRRAVSASALVLAISVPAILMVNVSPQRPKMIFCSGCTCTEWHESNGYPPGVFEFVDEDGAWYFSDPSVPPF